jgi:diguanylate cyclase (GGDEF)-like protein/PAS domain S-box-containing protein
VADAAETPGPITAAVDLAASQAVIDLGPSATPREAKDPLDPNGAWFTIAVQNRSRAPVARVLTAADPPGANIAFLPMGGRPMLVEGAVSDPAVIVERAIAFGENAFRVQVPPGRAATLALHFENVAGRPALLAWTEPALIANNRQAAVLAGLVSGLLTAAMAFAAGVAVLSSRIFPRWAALFLAAILIAQLTVTGVFDQSGLTALSGPYALFALAVAFAIAAGIRLVDYVAALEAIAPRAGHWRDRVALAIVALGVAAYSGLPFAGLFVRVLALIGAAAAAGYLAHCGRIGIAAARRLAPAATIFALVTAVAALNALGLFGVNLVASGAITGFAAAGALLVALGTALPVEHSVERVRELHLAHRDDDVQASVTDETLEQEREIAAVAASHQGVFDLDLEIGLLSLSAEAAALIGLPLGAVELGRESWLTRIHPDDRIIYEQALETYRHHTGTAFRVEFRIRGSGGRMIWCELRATMTGQATEAERCLGLIADVSARKSREAGEASAFTDALTGLGNRAALQTRLDELGVDLPRTALAVFDLDRFKAVNDSLGHDGADVALAAFVDRLEQNFVAEREPSRVTLFRVGGDMFAALGLNIASIEDFGETVLAVTAQPFAVANREVYLVASVGVASGTQAEDGGDLLAQAEIALIVAKREGGGRVSIYSTSFADAAPRDHVALEADLRRALERSEIHLYYQPVIRFSDGRIAGFEALLRWRHPERGLIEPQSFIPHAEESGLILRLGRFALDRAIGDLAQWQRRYPQKPPLFVSVNVAWRQIRDEAFAVELEALLKHAEIVKGSLKLEVTESAVMKGAQRAEEALLRLRSLGVGLAVDDFGTGHSALSHLRRFPFEAIKIDKSFIADAQEKAGAAILRSIISLARELKLAVVAEGVETNEDAVLLRQMGCEYGQGYLFGAPLPPQDAANFIAVAHAV